MLQSGTVSGFPGLHISDESRPFVMHTATSLSSCDFPFSVTVKVVYLGLSVNRSDARGARGAPYALFPGDLNFKALIQVMPASLFHHSVTEQLAYGKIF